jgi:FtsP/CotA-like multicopper oxidase with cupredoxin domain
MTAGLAAGAAVVRSPTAAGRERTALAAPPEIRSENGVLEAVLTAAAGTVRLGDVTFGGLLYDGSYLPPLLRARLGDTLRIRFRNALLDDPSNLHFHGMSVSPQGQGDNVFVHVHPGGTFNYEVQIPARGRQGPGLFWYHPHAHGVVDKQIMGGMSGGLVVEGSDKLYPFLKDLPERFLFLKQAQVGDRELLSINGQLDPVVEIRPGEMQLWRIANISAELFARLRIDAMPLYVLATDGHPLPRPSRRTELFLGPGERVDAIVVGPSSGEYALHTVSFQNEAWKEPAPSVRLATIRSRGTNASRANAEAHVLHQRLAQPSWTDEVRSAPIARRRSLTYSRTEDRKAFMINGRVIDEQRVDATVRLGDTEEWTIVNTDRQYHSFHIHQTPFLVTEVNGAPRKEDSLHDTFSVPPATEAAPGRLKVVIPFTDPVIVGRFVYHCHAVDHEDKGMMGVVEVVPKKTGV